MKPIEHSRARIAAGSALLVFSVLEIGSSLGKLVVLPNTDNDDRVIFFALLAVSSFAAIASLGMFFRFRAAYLGAVVACLILLGYTIFGIFTVVAVSSHYGYGVVQFTTPSIVAKFVILFTTTILFISKSARRVIGTSEVEQGESLKP